MPKRTDIKKIMIIGSGPIVIGQACEFDYSGTQACKALREEGYEVVLVNSNPATIMTDPEMAERVYLEPLTPELVAKIIEKERPQALLSTMGGQTALNLSVALADSGVLEKFGVELIGAKLEAIRKAEDREKFGRSMQKIGLDLVRGDYARDVEQAREVVGRIGLPVIIRPSFTLGGTGGGIADTPENFLEAAKRGLALSPISEILIEESVVGWKEYELEVMRDLKDNVVIICSIENFDPMGIHTGDSITVAPAQTLTDKEYQRMRDAALAVIREIGVETGGSNIQFAVHPETGRMVIIEMNPRVSRSSALASKATGFPIAKIAAKLSVGLTLDEIPNDITRKTPASFEPTIDYVVVKIPRFTFDKFPGTDDTLTVQMKSVGEVMAIGRTFKEALQKALRGLETNRYGLGADGREIAAPENLLAQLKRPNADRVFYIRQALLDGMEPERISELSKIDAWFIYQMKEIVEMEERLAKIRTSVGLTAEVLRAAKRMGFSDYQIGTLCGMEQLDVRRLRKSRGVQAVFKRVDTCGGEFEAHTPYLYSTYETEDESWPTRRRKVMILGSGPNRIGQGIEFDYCCVQAAFALREEGFESIMVNSNPETVSTDYDISDRLYFEPLTLEDVLNIVELEKPEGVIVQFGGQTPLKLAVPLAEQGVPIIGTSPASIDLAEDRERFGKLMLELGIAHPEYGIAYNLKQAQEIAARIGYPVLVRPSYVLGGQSMVIVYDDQSLIRYMKSAIDASLGKSILIDDYLEAAVEVDVDAISDGKLTVIGGIMQHIEEAGIHSGDSACVMPPHTLDAEILEQMRQVTRELARALEVKGLINIQFAVKDHKLYVLEVNPRASRTVPYVSKTIGISLAKLAAKVMIGRTLEELGFTKERKIKHISVKESVLPFIKFPNVDILLGPEMKSTGEVIGLGHDYGISYAKAQISAGNALPMEGSVAVSLADKDKTALLPGIRKLVKLGFRIYATQGTHESLKKNGVKSERVFKVGEGTPNIVDLINDNKISLLINTPMGEKSQYDAAAMRRGALTRGIPYVTTTSGAIAAIDGIEALKKGRLEVTSLQEYYA
ncbi:MAG: carbamoyl phosphate synthase large subunit [Candidatus Glassbacteria bacterium RIFCSPLOWO2_12_FULL_58_11]|uniref:Carbamoyl phosphate synthase large chain n=1 Tax=Candidatus Glassbacteria bacterium RIFCSPLOWO2_12_FULL_58_11 TaxID=1817867 RepID=A0A1F5YTQ4_9BACT|nr:MAG: carbamoyl phosphate synthase large subunit [Candidatus Glassbacteria bacterium RIFCSPLOWO2_12_FULL_58_11]